MHFDRPRSVCQGTFSNVDELTDWLEAFGIDTRTWGTGRAKVPDKLFKEIEANETTLVTDKDGCVFRQLNVVRVVVRQAGHMRQRYLACVMEKMEDGHFRERNQLPSEKLYAGETPAHAVPRCLLHELGALVKRRDIDVREETLVVRSLWGLTIGTPYATVACVAQDALRI